MHFRPTLPFIAAAILLSGISEPAFSDTAAAAGGKRAAGANKGISSEQPADGPYVKVEQGFMVPYTDTIPGTDIQFEMVPVAGGSFTMGSPPSGEFHREDEGPQVEITVAPMWVGKTEVTWRQYKEYMRMYAIFKEFESRGERVVSDENMSDAITAPTELYDPTFTFEYGEEPEQPAVTMTQYAAQQFTKWLSKLTGQQYRLPTEAEWEYAARGGTSTAFSWGDDPEEADQYAWYFDNADEGPETVATKKPNPFGLYDVHGNVAEWTVNQYTEEGYDWLKDSEVSKGVRAVRWPETPWPCTVRGGSWEMDPPDLRSAARLPSHDEDWKIDDPNFPKSPWWFTNDPARGVGFRLFRSLEPLEQPLITRFWEANAEETLLDVDSRLQGGRGGLGIVDETLPEAIQSLEED